jgi:bifunctional non-homologous end joining protein LigD
VEIEGKALNLSNLDKVLWPATGTTKGDMVNYYAQIAPVMVPHLVGRSVTLKRFPDGVE